ncbi:MAG: undecaprenyl-diphosphate phosphatase [Opitutaceae bacterium]|jgi:undecaprenyl-diphosphatase
MRRILAILLLAAPIACPSLPAAGETPQPAVAAGAQTSAAPKTKLSATDAVILGLVEGVTEFLPISSTGHLIIANELLGLESDAPLLGPDGKKLWNKKPSEKHPEGVPLTVKLAADTYTVIIQVGAIIAVALLYWKQILSVLRGLIGRDPDGLILFRNLLCAVVPVAIVGLLIHDWIDEYLFSVQAVIVAQISGAVLMIAAERWRKERYSLRASLKNTDELTTVESLGIGSIQCLALWPGTSRSMVTIVGGYFAGLSPAKAAEFSFLVGLPVLAGAALKKGVDSGSAMIAVFGWEHVLLGTVVAAITAAIAVKFLVAFLSRHGLFAFALYRFALAGLLGWYFFM